MCADLRQLDELVNKWLREASEAGSAPRFDDRYEKIVACMAEELANTLGKVRAARDSLLTPDEAHGKYGVSKRQLRRLENHGDPYKPLYLESHVAACRPRKRKAESASDACPVVNSALVPPEDKVEQLRSEIRERRSRAPRGKAA